MALLPPPGFSGFIEHARATQKLDFSEKSNFLAAAYRADSFELYGRLQRRFLAGHAIPDRYLVSGLDRLCRDVDDKTQALAAIDYKSLGVRQLGSINEGLLEGKFAALEPVQGLEIPG